MNRVAIPTGMLRLRSVFAGGPSARRLRPILLTFLTIVVWALTAISLGVIIGFSSVVLPPNAVFAIVGVAGLALLWVMPDMKLLPKRTLSAVFFINLVVTFCIPSYYTLIVPGIPWISLRRLAAFAVVVPVALAIGGSAEFRSVIAKRLASEKLLSACIILYIVWSFLSIVATESFMQTLVSGVDDVLFMYFPFFAALYLLSSIEKIERLMLTICWLSFFPTFMGVVEFFLHRRFYIEILPHSYVNYLMAENSTLANMVLSSPFRNGLYRASSLFGTPLSFGEFEMMLAPLGWCFLMHGKTPRRRFFGLAVTASSLLGIFASGSRGAYSGLLLELGVFALLWIARDTRTAKNSIIPAFASVFSIAGAGALAGLFTFSGRLHATLFGSSGIDQASADARWAQWANLKPRLFESPMSVLIGHGRGMSGVVIAYYYPGATWPTVDSYLLTCLADVGIPGTIFWFGSILLGIWSGGRRYFLDDSYAGALAGGLGCSLVGFLLYRFALSQGENFLLLILILAMLISISAVAPFPDQRARS